MGLDDLHIETGGAHLAGIGLVNNKSYSTQLGGISNSVRQSVSGKMMHYPKSHLVMLSAVYKMTKGKK